MIKPARFCAARKFGAASVPLILFLQGCGSTAPSAAPAGEQSGSHQAAPSVAKDDHIALRAAFESMAPKGWELKDYEEGIASYTLSERLLESASRADAVFAAITLDGRNEALVKMGWGVARPANTSQEQIDEASLEYPVVDGYKMDVNPNPLAYSAVHMADVRQLAYYDFAKGISCHGRYPGQFQCHWGSKMERYSLFFMSEDIEVILPYVAKLAGAN
jgi:hypothetical protein